MLKLLGKPRHDQGAAATSDFAPDQAVPKPSSTWGSSDGPAPLPPGVLGSTCPTQPTCRSARAWAEGGGNGVPRTTPFLRHAVAPRRAAYHRVWGQRGCQKSVIYVPSSFYWILNEKYIRLIFQNRPPSFQKYWDGPTMIIN